MADFVNKGDMQLADQLHEMKNYGKAIAEYRVCLEYMKENEPTHKDKISYLEMQIADCQKYL